MVSMVGEGEGTDLVLNRMMKTRNNARVPGNVEQGELGN
jgi:transcription termination factor Rho